jgi:hypothetical protein
MATDVQTRIPFAYMSDGIAAMYTVTSAFSSAIATGACSPPSIDLLGGATSGYLHTLDSGHPLVLTMPEPGDLCGSTTLENVHLGEVFGARIWLRDLESLAVLMAFLAALWKLMPWSRRGDMEPFVTAGGTAGGGLSGWSDLDKDRAADPDRPEA